MPKRNQLFYPWCVLVAGILTISILPAGSWIYQFIAGYYSDRWVHFVAYASAATVPVAVGRYRKKILLSFVPVAVSIVFEAFRAGTLGPHMRTQNVPADLFGLAAGILLGLNIRVMRNSAKSKDNVTSNASNSASS